MTIEILLQIVTGGMIVVSIGIICLSVHLDKKAKPMATKEGECPADRFPRIIGGVK